jgi:hypothetical protein
MRHVRRYRLVCRMNGNDVDAATFPLDETWRPGDTVTLGPQRHYRIVEVLPGEPPFDAVWVVEALWQP